MMNALQPENVLVARPLTDGPNTGDGIKACLWMGAVMDDTHSSMLFDRVAILPTESEPSKLDNQGLFINEGSQPWLKVNLNGERFVNESGTYDNAAHAAAKEPGHCYCSIFDANFFENMVQFSTIGCSREFCFPNGAPYGRAKVGTTLEQSKESATANIEEAVEQGYIQKADTLEELATMLNIPADSFVATVERYNGFCDAGVDEDFGKDAYRLIALRTPPYYGFRNTTKVNCTLDGIRIDTDMRPLDEEGVPFEGLYVIGDCSGSFFSYTYPNLVAGLANGRTLTWARHVVANLSA